METERGYVGVAPLACAFTFLLQVRGVGQSLQSSGGSKAKTHSYAARSFLRARAGYQHEFREPKN